ncbi:extracellular solute-binding protein, partial [mine drainage metagenome]
MYSTHTPTLLALTSQGKVQYTTFPTQSIFFFAFDMNVSISGLLGILPSGDIVNVPSTFFSDVAVRQMMVHAWPYATYQNTIATVDGVQYGFQYGGVIPQFMGNYYPTNISWPSGNPITNPSVVGSAAWWWAQGTNLSSPYFSKLLAACTSANPCIYPIIGQLGNPGLDDALTLYISEIEQITGGAVQPYSYDITFTDAVVYSVSSEPGHSPVNLFTLGWIPDYPDPSNNFAAMYQPNATYTTGTALYQAWSLPAFNNASCGYSDYSSWAALSHWANIGYLPQDCQGVAYQTLSAWSITALHEPDLTQRTLDYN